MYMYMYDMHGGKQLSPRTSFSYPLTKDRVLDFIPFPNYHDLYNIHVVSKLGNSSKVSLLQLS